MKRFIGTSRRRWRRGVPVIAACLFAIVFVSSAQAVHDTGLFELDGNAVNDSAVTGDDWDNVCHQVVGSGCSTSNDTSAAGGATEASWVSEPNPNSTIFTGGGSKDPQNISSWAWKDGAGGLPDKDNLLHSFAARYSTTPSANCPSGTASTCDVLYFGSDRLDNSGDAQQGFWFFQNKITLGNTSSGGGVNFNGVHRNGDLLVISDFSNGGTTSTISIYKWNSAVSGNLQLLQSSTAANCATAGAHDAFCGIVNPTNGTTAPWSFTDKSGLHSYLQGEFYEGGVNLSTLGLSDECFSSVASETRSSTSTTATLKDFVLGQLGNCTSTVTTTPKTGTGGAIPSGGLSIGTGSVSAKDSATLTVGGVHSWSGTLVFSLCGPISTGTCDSGGTQVDSQSVDNTQTQPFVSAAATVTSAGRYCWRADFTSDTTGVPNATDSASTECFTVNPVTPTLATTAGSGPVNFGQPVTDTASLTGLATQPGDPIINGGAGSNAGGTISFTLYKADCTTLATGTGDNPQTVTVNGNNTAYGPASFTPDAPGTYHWVASYTPASGDPNNNSSSHNTTCDDTAEDVVVRQIPTAISTAQSAYPNDSATISSSISGDNLGAGGTVVFRLYDNSTCTATDDNVIGNGLLYKQSRTLTGGTHSETVSTSNTTVAVNSSQTVYWKVTYAPPSGDTAHTGRQSNCLENTVFTFNNNSGPGTLFP